MADWALDGDPGDLRDLCALQVASLCVWMMYGEDLDAMRGLEFSSLYQRPPARQTSNHLCNTNNLVVNMYSQ